MVDNSLTYIPELQITDNSINKTKTLINMIKSLRFNINK